MTADQLRQSVYAQRLEAVRRALADAEAAGRYGEAEAFRLAETVLVSLLAERPRVVPVEVDADA